MSGNDKYPDNATRLQVRQVRHEAEGINSYEFVHPEGEDLPSFEAGSHVDFYFRDGTIRQYSLANDPSERHRYLIGVLREPHGRGGSEALHERVHPQREVYVGNPRNNFPLFESAKRHLLLAGGIGITPMLSYTARLQTIGADFTLHYCAKSARHAAFRAELAHLEKEGRVKFHYDGGDPSRGLDIESLLKSPEPGTHLYYCGPPGFMGAIEKFSSHWPDDTVHFEFFNAAASPKKKLVNDELASISGGDIGIGFEIKIASTGAIFSVPNDKSIVEVLKENDIEVEVSCESGLCGTCVTPYLEGKVDHQDLILTPEQRKTTFTPCCSRSKSKILVIDL